MEESNPVAETAEPAVASTDSVLAAETAEPAVASTDSVLAAEPAAQLEAITAERDQLAQEKAELRDRLVRRQADFENFRRRVARERTELVEFAGMESVRALLPVVDDFERALKVECADKEYVRGMDLICQRLFEALGKLGLEPIAAAGQPFDPNLHHAVEMVQTGEAGDQTVIEEYQRGYNFRGRLLRPSMVKVAVRPKNGKQ
jgi:molecular chaperone GrpE